MNNSIEALKLLLLQDASWNIRDKNCKNSVHLAVTMGDIKIMKMLMEYGASVDVVNNKVRTAFHLAARKVIDLLLQQSAVVNAKDSNDQTALQLATFKGSIEARELLLKHGFSVHD